MHGHGKIAWQPLSRLTGRNCSGTGLLPPVWHWVGLCFHGNLILSSFQSLLLLGRTQIIVVPICPTKNYKVHHGQVSVATSRRKRPPKSLGLAKISSGLTITVHRKTCFLIFLLLPGGSWLDAGDSSTSSFSEFEISHTMYPLDGIMPSLLFI